MSEKKSNIKSGLNIDVDNGNVIVLNDVSVAEKEEKVQENTVKEEPIVPDIKITPEVKEPDINNIPLPEVPSINQTPDFIVPTVNTPSPAPVIEPVAPTPIMQTTPEINPEPVQYSNNNFNSVSNNDLYSQSFNNFNKLPENENRIFKSKGDVEKLSEEVANEIKNALNAHVVYPMKATTDLLHELYEWGRAVTDNGLNRQLLEDYDALKKKYSDLESVCTGEKSVQDININNDFNNNFSDNYSNKSNDDYNDFGGFGGFGRAA